MKKQSNLTTKDLSYINDIFNWQINCYNAVSHFQNLLTDQKAQEMCGNILKMHKKMCNELLKTLEGED